MFEKSVNIISMLFRLHLTNPEMPHQLTKLLLKTLKVPVIGSFNPKMYLLTRMDISKV
jgi:hypothetical protein